MTVLLDTNIIVDVALQRQPHFEASQQVLLLVEQGQIEGYISASTFSDLYSGSQLDEVHLVSGVRSQESGARSLQARR